MTEDTTPEYSEGQTQIIEGEQHYVETFRARHFPTTVEIWCPLIDETKVVIGDACLRHCPMCGGSVEVPEDAG